MCLSFTVWILLTDIFKIHEHEYDFCVKKKENCSTLCIMLNMNCRLDQKTLLVCLREPYILDNE